MLRWVVAVVAVLTLASVLWLGIQLGERQAMQQAADLSDDAPAPARAEAPTPAPPTPGRPYSGGGRLHDGVPDAVLQSIAVATTARTLNFARDAAQVRGVVLVPGLRAG